MSSTLPVRFQELFKLPALGVSPGSINFNSTTMESEKFICVREDLGGGSSQIVIVDVATQQVMKHKIKAEAALMHPSSKVLALRSGQTLQIFNLDLRTKMKSHTMEDGVVFWKWTSVSSLALVTATSVFHWSMDGDSAPVKVFDRHADLAGASVINYRVDSSGKWFLLIGLTRGADGSPKGMMQLYSVERKVSQSVEGHAGAFCDFKHPGGFTSTLCCIAVNRSDGGRLFVMEVPGARAAGAPEFSRVNSLINFASPQDFPVAMQISEKHGVIFMSTRMGLLYMFDVETGALIFSNKISAETVFVTAPHAATGGFVGINRSGQVLMLSVDENSVVPYIKTQLSNMDLAIRIAVRADLPGADDVFVSQFNRLISEMRVPEAIKLAIDSPQGILRTQQTIERLQQVPVGPGQAPAVSQYFKTIIETSRLNSLESVEVAKLFLAKGGVAQLGKLFDDDKLECGEQLGDLAVQYDRELALKIFVKGNVPQKVVALLAEKGAYEQILAYTQKIGYNPDYVPILTNLIGVNPDGGVTLAKLLASQDPPLVNIGGVVDLLVQRTMIPQVTDFLLDVLKGNREDQGPLQTRLLEINLLYSPPQVADRILGAGMFTQFDRDHVAKLCEKAGLYHRALENYSDISDIRRVVVNTNAMDPAFLLEYFGKLSVEESLVCLRELLRVNMRQNGQIVTQIATKYSEQLTPEALIEMFETFKCFDGMFYYLGSIISYSENPEVHFKYIEAATRCQQFPEVERVTRESNFYDPERTKEFLKEARLPDQWPIINVCDKYDYMEELVSHLYHNNQLKFLDAFLLTKNPMRTPVVVGTLLDLDAREDYVKNLVMSVGSMCPVEPLVEEVEKRNRLKLLLPWLEARMNEGSQEPALHNALAMVYIDLNRDAEQFLENNEYYDSNVVGKYCEKRDPHLAFAAYKRGQCDYELVEVCNRNSMFRQEARYLVERQNGDLWAFVLNAESKHRRHLIDAVVQYALPESRNPDEVSSTVKAFMTADLPNELIELLEKIVLQGNSEFKTNKNLQNLLILTAIKADKTRVMEYIQRLDNYDAPDIANIAKNAQLFEEAFAIYKKFDLHADATTVLLDNIHSIERAQEYAERVNETEVWSLLARAQLEEVMFPDAVDSFLKADDATCYLDVIDVAERSDHFADLVRYLRMARTKVKDAQLDTELVYSLAKTNAMAELEEFVSQPTVAKIQIVGDRCFDEELFEAAKILFTNIGNHSRLASALVKLGQFQAAVEAARKANSTKTWKEVNFACVDAEEFRLAQVSGLHIVVHADELEELCVHYEERGHFEELIQLLEAGAPLERAHMGLFTELGRLYSRYRPAKLMEHIKLFWQRVNIPRLIRSCELDHHWAELRFLYSHYDEYDNAVRVMIEHPHDAWDHTVFKELIVQCRNSEMYHRAVGFYLEQAPLSLVDLLTTLAPKIDHNRVVADVRRAGHLPLIKPYLVAVQDNNLTQINEALNELLVEEEDFDELRKSIDTYDNFDQIALAQLLERHEMLEFRRIAAYIFKRNDRFEQSVELSKKDRLYRDAMETAADSRSQPIAEGLLEFFVEVKDSACFVACLFMCYDLLRPDVVLELAWTHKIMDFAMPYMTQVLREYVSKVDELSSEREERARKAEKGEEPEDDVVVAPGGIVAGVMPGEVAPLPFMQTGVPFMNTGYQGPQYY